MSAPRHLALDDVSLHIPRGEVYGLLGPNGAGKTTLLSILIGLTPKDAGRVRVDGLDLDREAGAIKSRIGFVPQDLAFYPMLTVRENLSFFAAAQGIPRARRAARIDFAVATTELGAHLGKQAAALSGGLKRRLNIAIGLLNQPAVLCLDEPTVGIDPQSRNFILEAILRLRDEGLTVIYTSHYMEEVQQICTRVAVIDAGRILIEGAIDELLGGAGGQVLRVSFEQALSEAQAGRLVRELDASLEGERGIRVSGASPERSLAVLAEVAHEEGLVIRTASYGFRNLEDLFLSLTHKRLRD